MSYMHPSKGIPCHVLLLPFHFAQEAGRDDHPAFSMLLLTAMSLMLPFRMHVSRARNHGMRMVSWEIAARRDSNCWAGHNFVCNFGSALLVFPVLHPLLPKNPAPENANSALGLSLN